MWRAEEDCWLSVRNRMPIFWADQAMSRPGELLLVGKKYEDRDEVVVDLRCV